MHEYRIVAIAQRKIQGNQARRHKVTQIVERQADFATFTSWNNKTSNDLYAIDTLHSTLKQPIAIKVFTLRIVRDGCHNRNIIASALQLEGYIVTLKVFWLKVLRNKQYAFL